TEIQAAGYQAVYCGQKANNGVAVLARSALTDVQHGIPDFADDLKRVTAATISNLRILCLYAPNGEAPGTDKYAYKLRWYEALTSWLREEL
ncbi:exodeoxyribonuclease III, partial [Vibrio parahaemolyticus]|nr:exodeoxyribonuclease III [Vibrio parahaemolyticus]